MTHHATYTKLNQSHSFCKKEVPLRFFARIINLWNRLLRRCFPVKFNLSILKCKNPRYLYYSPTSSAISASS